MNYLREEIVAARDRKAIAYTELILRSVLPPEVRKTDFSPKMVRFWSVFASKSPFSFMVYVCMTYHWNRHLKGF